MYVGVCGYIEDICVSGYMKDDCVSGYMKMYVGVSGYINEFFCVWKHDDCGWCMKTALQVCL